MCVKISTNNLNSVRIFQSILCTSSSNTTKIASLRSQNFNLYKMNTEFCSYLLFKVFIFLWIFALCFYHYLLLSLLGYLLITFKSEDNFFMHFIAANFFLCKTLSLTIFKPNILFSFYPGGTCGKVGTWTCGPDRVPFQVYQ